VKWCFDWYAAYTSGVKIDPPGASSGPIAFYATGAGTSMLLARNPLPGTTSIRTTASPTSASAYTGLSFNQRAESGKNALKNFIMIHPVLFRLGNELRYKRKGKTKN